MRATNKVWYIQRTMSLQTLMRHEVRATFARHAEVAKANFQLFPKIIRLGERYILSLSYRLAYNLDASRREEAR
ncbi:hypothetical protein CRI94_09960 [Longibacter salinarum]|uniref:Uncharacterized protein n=1 Tax=Longibacter salinarum TaxID=1850348 RepID=A0A2A8CY31_9BACT|nr:hypothetical protein CRI94_09960 [Longibacter salinarum]